MPLEIIRNDPTKMQVDAIEESNYFKAFTNKSKQNCKNSSSSMDSVCQMLLSVKATVYRRLKAEKKPKNTAFFMSGFGFILPASMFCLLAGR